MEKNLNSYNPILSVISVNYNGKDDTILMLNSLLKHLPGDFLFEAIVVDNCSRENQADLIKEVFKDDERIHCIRSEKNLGFAGGNNLGAAYAKGCYLFFLNNDTELIDDSVLKICKFLEENPTAGGAMPKICFFDPPNLIQSVGFTPFSKISLRNSSIGFMQKNENFNTVLQTPYLHGAAMIIPRSVWEKVGIMPDFYFLYYEELDYSLMLNRARYSLWCIPECTILHKESRTTGANSPLKAYYMTRNRLLFAYRNLQGFNKFASISYQYLIALPKFIIINLFKGNLSNVKASISAALNFISFPKKNIRLN